MKLQQELFDDLTLRKFANIASEKTREIREARDDAFKVYTRLSNAYNLCWQEAFEVARDTMIIMGK